MKKLSTAALLLCLLSLHPGLAQAAGFKPLSTWRVVAPPTYGSAQWYAANNSTREWAVALVRGQPAAALRDDDGPAALLPFRVPTGYIYGHQRYAVRVADGWLVGFNAGEWGGQLWWFSPEGRRRYEVSRDQVCGFVPTFGGLRAITGLAHLGYSDGSLIALARTRRGRWQSSQVAALGDAPFAAALDRDGSIIVLTLRRLERVLLTGKVETLLRNEAWGGLYANSLVRAPGGMFYAGMRFYVICFKVGPLKARADWLLPTAGGKAAK